MGWSHYVQPKKVPVSTVDLCDRRSQIWSGPFVALACMHARACVRACMLAFCVPLYVCPHGHFGPMRFGTFAVTDQRPLLCHSFSPMLKLVTSCRGCESQPRVCYFPLSLHRFTTTSAQLSCMAWRITSIHGVRMAWRATCAYRADWEPEAASGRRALGVSWGCSAALWGPSTPNPTRVSGKPLF